VTKYNNVLIVKYLFYISPSNTETSVKYLIQVLVGRLRMIRSLTDVVDVW